MFLEEGMSCAPYICRSLWQLLLNCDHIDDMYTSPLDLPSLDKAYNSKYLSKTNTRDLSNDHSLFKNFKSYTRHQFMCKAALIHQTCFW